MSRNTISAEVGLRLSVPQQPSVPLVVSFLYCGEDPYAVRIAFRAGVNEPVDWAFARDLLSSGIQGRVGDGDVTVWPSATTEGGTLGSVLHIELSSPFGQAHLEAPAGQISDFLRRTYQVVPAGQESEHLDIEAGLADLLRPAS